MALADFTPERVTIQHKGNPLVSVRGLSLDDVSVLVRGHLDVLGRLFAEAGKGTENLFARLNDDGFMVKLVVTAPEIAATVITLAADEPDLLDRARQLPLPLQVKVLREIMRLTFEDVGGPKAFVALITEMIGQQQP